MSWGPVVDGKVLPQVPADALRGGTHHKVPIVIGSNSEETGVSTPLITTEAEYRAALTGLVGAALTDRAMMLYPSATYGSPRRALVQVTTDAFFGCQARIASRVAARGAFHGLELSSVFQKLSELLPMPPAADAAVEASILGAWTRFAATGSPNGGSLPRWTGVSAPEPFLQLDSVVTTGTGWRNAEGDFWDAVAGVMIPPPP